MYRDKVCDYFEAAFEKIASWRVKIGQLSNIEIWLHHSFWIIGLGLPVFLSFECLKHWVEWKYDLFYLWISCSLVLAVLAHEIGHVVMAKALGCRKTVLAFHVLGGIAFFDKESFSAKPWKMLLVCASGPIANLGLVCLSWYWMNHANEDGRLLLEIFGEMNLVLLINLLPLYPLDGGRIFKAFLEIIGISEKIVLKSVLCCSLLGYFGLLWFWIAINEWLGVAELVILAPLLLWIIWLDSGQEQAN